MSRKGSTGLLPTLGLLGLLGSFATQAVFAQGEEPLPPTSDPAAPRLSIADPELVERYIASLREMREALAGFRWNTRTTIRIDDREWIVQLFDVRLDGAGRLRKTLTGHELRDPAIDGPIRRRVVPLGGTEEAVSGREAALPADEQAASLKRLAESYTYVEPSDVRRVPLLPAPLTSLQPLTPLGGSLPMPIGEDGPAIETSFRLYDVIRVGDSFEVWLGDTDGQPVRLEATTDLEGTPVEVSAQYSRLPDGTVCPARSVIRTVIEQRKVEVRVEAFGFEKGRAAN